MRPRFGENPVFIEVVRASSKKLFPRMDLCASVAALHGDTDHMNARLLNPNLNARHIRFVCLFVWFVFVCLFFLTHCSGREFDALFSDDIRGSENKTCVMLFVPSPQDTTIERDGAERDEDPAVTDVVQNDESPGTSSAVGLSDDAGGTLFGGI